MHIYIYTYKHKANKFEVCAVVESAVFYLYSHRYQEYLYKIR